MRGSPSPTIVKSMGEHSPNSLSERTLPSMSLISGTENVVLSWPPLGALWRMYTSRFSSRFTSGFSSTPRTSVKMAALAPMPSASVRITMAASPLLRINDWNAPFRSRKNDMVLATSAALLGAPAQRGEHQDLLHHSAHDRAHLDRRPTGDDSLAPPRQCLVQVSGLHYPKTAYVLLDLQPRPVRDGHLAIGLQAQRFRVAGPGEA